MLKPILIVYGASGAGRNILDIALEMIESHPGGSFTSTAVIDDEPSELNLARLNQAKVPYLGTSDCWLKESEPSHFAIGVGDTRIRRALAEKLMAAGHAPATIIAPTARVSRSASLGLGAFISPGVDISANSRLGDFVHVLANSAIGHDACIDGYVNINSGAVVAGDCHIGQGATLGAGATVLQGLSIGARSMVGASACVTRAVPPDLTVKGVPAR